MQAIVAYSRPRGKYGYYVFTVVIYFNAKLKEEADIKVTDGKVVYSCGYCGKWATITIQQELKPTVKKTNGKLVYYRYDNVRPGHQMTITLRDPSLLFYQVTCLDVKQRSVTINHECRLVNENDFDDDIDDITGFIEVLEGDIPSANSREVIGNVVY